MKLHSPQDISTALAQAMGAGGLVLREEDLSPAFFDLKTRLAGELFQKFVNYQVRLAIVVRDPAAHGDRFTELAREHLSHPLVRILPDQASASAWVAGAERR